MLRSLGWLSLVTAAMAAPTEEFYVCNSGDPLYSGTYEIGVAHANKHSWTNEHGKTIFAHGPFWCLFQRSVSTRRVVSLPSRYIGDLEVHPPDTHYRGVEGCPEHADEPATGGGCYYRASARGKHPVPVLQTVPCSAASDEL